MNHPRHGAAPNLLSRCFLFTTGNSKSEFGKVQATLLASRLSNTRERPKNRSVLRSDTVERTRLPQPTPLPNTLLAPVQYRRPIPTHVVVSIFARFEESVRKTMVFGSVLPIRAAVMPQHFSGALYGRLMGLQDMTGSYAVP